MDHQIASTLWLSPNMCVLSALPTIPMHPAQIRPHQYSTPQLLDHSFLTVPTNNIVHNAQILHHPHMISSPQNIVHVPLENLLVPPASTDATIDLQSPAIGVHSFTAVQAEPQTSPPRVVSSSEASTPVPSMNSASKVLKKRRISPSAKRRSRLRLIAFLEQKKKQQDELGDSTPEK